jgi:hypothetical protein
MQLTLTFLTGAILTGIYAPMLILPIAIIGAAYACDSQLEAYLNNRPQVYYLADEGHYHPQERKT